MLTKEANAVFTDIQKRLSNEEQRELARSLLKHTDQTVRRSLSPGDEVSFKTRSGELITGRVTKVNEKSVKVMGDKDRYGYPNPTLWTVSPGLLNVNLLSKTGGVL